MDPLLDARQLQAFVAVSRNGNMTQAARELFLTASAVSHAISELEERVHCRLLDRRHKKIELTQAGEQLLKDAQKILQQMVAAKASMQNFGKLGHDRIRLAASAAFCEHIIPRILREFHAHYPHCHVVVDSLDTMDAVDLVRENKVDLAIGLEPPACPELQFTPLFVDELIVLIGSTHRWANRPSIDANELSTEPFLQYKRDALISTLIENFLREENIELNISIEAGDMELIKGLVVANLGISILPSWVAKKELEEGKVTGISLLPNPLRLAWGCICYNERRLTLAEETFLAISRTATRKVGNCLPYAA